jgi:uncharacterized membrane protein
VQSRARVLGEQLNPLLTVLPLGMLGSAVLFDLGALISGTVFFAHVALWDMAAGLLAGLVAVGATLVDLIVAPSPSTARRVLALEAAATGSMVVLFGIIWVVRTVAKPVGVDGLFVVEVLALAAGVAGAWLARGIVAGDGLPERRRPSGQPSPYVTTLTYGAPSTYPATPRVAPRQSLPSWYTWPTLPGVYPPAPAAWAAQASSSATLRANPSRPS